jgi:hypothetical protein
LGFSGGGGEDRRGPAEIAAKEAEETAAARARLAFRTETSRSFSRVLPHRQASAADRIADT